MNIIKKIEHMKAIKMAIRNFLMLAEFRPADEIMVKPTVQALVTHKKKYSGSIPFYYVADRIEIVTDVRVFNADESIVTLKFYPVGDDVMLTAVTKYISNTEKEWQSVLLLGFRIAAAIQGDTLI